MAVRDPLSPTLRRAFTVAQVLAAEGVPTPPALAPILRFAKLSARAERQVEGALNDDDEFREAVRSALDAESPGGDGSTVEDDDFAPPTESAPPSESASPSEAEAGRLFLQRPDGWQERLEELRSEAAGESTQKTLAKALREAEKRVRSSEAALEAAREAVRHATVEVGEANAQLDEARRRRRSVEDLLETESAALAEAESALAAAAIEAEASAVRIADLTDRLLTADERAEAGRADLAEARTEIDRLAAERSRLAARLAELEGGPISEDATAMLSRVIGQASASAAAMASALDAASGVLAGRDRPAKPPADAAGAGDDRPRSRRRPPEGSRPPRRQPVPPPPGLSSDSDEGVTALLATEGLLVLVDGYNVALAGWPGRDLATTRKRLSDELAELSLRQRLRVHVVWDGDSVDGPAMPVGPPRGGIAVTEEFTPAAVEADAFLLALVERTPLATPVAVVTSDRAVRDGVRALGGNVIRSGQLLRVFGRG